MAAMRNCTSDHPFVTQASSKERLVHCMTKHSRGSNGWSIVGRTRALWSITYSICSRMVAETRRGRASVEDEKAARRSADRPENPRSRSHGVRRPSHYSGPETFGLEGIVAKDTTSPYVEGPAENRFWLKIKKGNFKRKEPVGFRTLEFPSGATCAT